MGPREVVVHVVEGDCGVDDVASLGRRLNAAHPDEEALTTGVADQRRNVPRGTGGL